eukprot:2320647-Rhodomonas_salina.8
MAGPVTVLCQYRTWRSKRRARRTIGTFALYQRRGPQRSVPGSSIAFFSTGHRVAQGIAVPDTRGVGRGKEKGKKRGKKTREKKRPGLGEEGGSVEESAVLPDALEVALLQQRGL